MWDTQSDMALALLRAVSELLILLRVHDSQFNQLRKKPVMDSFLGHRLNFDRLQVHQNLSGKRRLLNDGYDRPAAMGGL